jgi:hypothetical protein
VELVIKSFTTLLYTAQAMLQMLLPQLSGNSKIMWSMLNCPQLVSFTPQPLYSQGKIPSTHASISVIKQQNPILDVESFTQEANKSTN